MALGPSLLLISAFNFYSDGITSKTEFVEQFKSYQVMCLVFELRPTRPTKHLISSIVDSGKTDKEGAHAVTLRLNASSDRLALKSRVTEHIKSHRLMCLFIRVDRKISQQSTQIASNVGKFRRSKWPMQSNYSSMCTEERRRVAGDGWETHVAGNPVSRPIHFLQRHGGRNRHPRKLAD